MGDNHVVIYSNGIADFQRCITIEPGGPQTISLPVRRDHLADVLGSFNVYGNVKLESPPTFRPSNELEGNVSINPHKVLEDLATGLSGARVRVDRAGGVIEGTLVGLHQEEEATGGDPVQLKSIVILTDEGLRRCALREIVHLKFLDEDVRKEIDKALQRSYQRIKPNSTFIELVLSTEGGPADAVLQYTIPAAAWKISYRLRVTEGKLTELQGFAVVDNNTDDDWTDFHVSVVTGEPITFSTDLAESKIPHRSHVALVSATALGAIEVESPAVVLMAPGASGGAAMGAPEEQYAKQSLKLRSKRLAPAAELASAQTTPISVEEVGDFNVFECETSVSIPARKSAVISLFSVTVDDTRSVLHYKYENHAKRPYRSIDFTNRTPFSLGRGACTVYDDGTFSGSCILPPTKPGEQQLLPHALETGVSVHRELKIQRSKIVALRLADGFCHQSSRLSRETEYHIRNSRDREYELVLDHTHQLKKPDLVAQLIFDGREETLEITTRLEEGVRYSVHVGAHSQQIVRILEQRIERTSIELITTTKQFENIQIDWLKQNLVASNGPLAQDEGIRACLQIQQEIESIGQEIADAISETERLAARQERLRQNIKSGGQDELTNRWREELDHAERNIKLIEEERLPALRNDEKKLRGNLKDAIRSLSAEWSDLAPA